MLDYQIMDKKCGSISKKYEVFFVYNEPVSRVCTLLSDPKKIAELNSKTQLPYLFTDKPIPLQFNYILGEYTSVEYKKKINWILESKDIPTSINYCFHIIANTLDNTSLLIFQIIINQPFLISPEKQNRVVDGLKTICVEMINAIDTLLQLSNECIYEFKSSIIKAPIEKIWTYITCQKGLNRMFAIENIQYSGPIDKVGTVISWMFVKENIEGKCEIKVYDNDPKNKEWKYCIIPLGGPLQNQEVLFTLIKINDNKTFLSFSHKFNEIINKETISKLEKKKISIITVMKKDLEKES